MFQEQKRRVSWLEESVRKSKDTYSEALRKLEAISDEIHRQRHESRLRAEMGTRGAGVGAEAPSPPPDSDGDFTPDNDHAGFIDPLGVLKGSHHRRCNFQSRSASDHDKFQMLTTPDDARSETEGKSSDTSEASQDVNNVEISPCRDREEPTKETVQETEQQMLPDPLNATLLPSTATKQVPKLSPARKATKLHAGHVQTTSVKASSSLPSNSVSDTQLPSTGDSNPDSSHESSTSAVVTAPASSSDTGPVNKTAVPPSVVVAKQVRPTSISSSPPRNKAASKATVEAVQAHLKDTSISASAPVKPRAEDTSHVPVLTVQALPQSNISSSRVVVSQDADAPAPAVTLMASSQDADSGKEASEEGAASDSTHTADLLSPFSDKSASTTPAYEVRFFALAALPNFFCFAFSRPFLCQCQKQGTARKSKTSFTEGLFALPGKKVEFVKKTAIKQFFMSE